MGIQLIFRMIEDAREKYKEFPEMQKKISELHKTATSLSKHKDIPNKKIRKLIDRLFEIV